MSSIFLARRGRISSQRLSIEAARAGECVKSDKVPTALHAAGRLNCLIRSGLIDLKA
jgi:hypothetical protein